MKKHIKDFIRNGLLACGLGPVVWSIIYVILCLCGVVDEIPVIKATVEVVSVTVLAFIAGGIVVVYKIESLPLVAATLIHAIALYVDYVVIYLMNGWLDGGITPLIIFTLCFAVGFAIIWCAVYFTTKKSAEKINSQLALMQSDE